VTLDTQHTIVIVYQPLIDKMYKSQSTLILNLFEGTIDVTIFLLRNKENSFILRKGQSVSVLKYQGDNSAGLSVFIFSSIVPH
jgi:hypothetical protein